MADLASLGIAVDSSGVVTASGNLERLVEHGKHATSAVKEMQEQFENLGRNLMNLNQSFELARGLIEGFERMTEAWVDQFREAEQATSKVEAVIRATGHAAGFTGKQIGEMAEELSKATVYEADTIKNAQGILLTFKSIKGDTFEEATKAVLDLSAAFGGDLQGSAVMLGKALEDPVQGLTALHRMGVSFSDSEKEVIKTLYESGQVAEAQAKILETLKGQVGGVAEAFGNTAAGQLLKYENSVKQVNESLGQAATTIKNLMNQAMSPLNGIVKDIADAFNRLDPETQKAIVTFTGLTAGAVALTAAVIGIRAAMVALGGISWSALGPFAWAIGAGVAVAALVTAIDSAKHETENLIGRTEKLTSAAQEQYDSYQKLMGPISEKNKVEKITADQYDKLIGIYPALIGQISAYGSTVDEVASKVRRLNDEQDKQAFDVLLQRRMDVLKKYQESVKQLNVIPGDKLGSDATPENFARGEKLWSGLTAKSFMQSYGLTGVHDNLLQQEKEILELDKLMDAIHERINSRYYTKKSENGSDSSDSKALDDITKIVDDYKKAMSAIDIAVNQSTITYEEGISKQISATSALIETFQKMDADKKLSKLLPNYDEYREKLLELNALEAEAATTGTSQADAIAKVGKSAKEAAKPVDALYESLKNLGLSLGISEEGSKQFATDMEGITKSLMGVAAQGAVDGIKAIGKALATGSDAGKDFNSAMADMALKVLDSLPILLLQAGLNLVAMPGWAGVIPGLALIAASGIIALEDGYIHGAIENKKNGNTTDAAATPTGSAAAGVGPERLAPGSTGVSASMSVNIVNTTGQPVSTTETKGPNGRELQVMVGQIIDQRVASGKMDGALGQRYGIRFNGIQRA